MAAREATPKRARRTTRARSTGPADDGDAEGARPRKGRAAPAHTARGKHGASKPAPAPATKHRRRPADDASQRASDGELGLPYLINLIANYVNESMREDLARAGMTVPRWTVLAALRDEDGQTIGDLSRHCLIRQSSLTRVVDQLERDGHVRRRRARRDQRVVQVSLTPAGRAIYEDTVPDVVERASAAVRQLVASEMDQLNAVLERARDALRGEGASADSPPALPPAKKQKGSGPSRPTKKRSSRSAARGGQRAGKRD